LAASTDTTRFCASGPEALECSTAVAAGDDGEQASSADRCAEAGPTDQTAARCDALAGAMPVPGAESKFEPTAMPSTVALVAIAVVVMLGTIEVLFRCTIYERPSSADHRQAEKKGIKGTRA
jgi:hypothetical protein